MTQCDPDVGIKSNPNFPKVAPKRNLSGVFLNGGAYFKIAQKVAKYLGYFLLQITFENRQIWSHWLGRGVTANVITLDFN